MRRPLRVVVQGVRGVVFGAVVLAAVAGARVMAAEEPFDSLPRFLTVRPRYGDGRLIALDIVALRQRSATFRAVLLLLESHLRVRVLVAPTPVRPADGLFGRTTFGMGVVELVAAVDVFVDERSQALTLEALGHEFGHVVEAVCLRGGATTIKDLDGRLRRQAVRTPGGGATFETPFAVAVGKAVAREFLRPGASSRLDGLARRYRLGGCRQGPASGGDIASAR